MRLEVACAGLVLFAAAAHAQVLVPPDPDWREAEVPAPAAFRTDNLIPIEMPGSTLRFGISPESIVIGSDGIVRYVVVATSTSGAVNALYEGIRCNSGEFKVYARYNPGSGWVRASEPDWRALNDERVSRHTLTVARNGACIGHGANQPASAIARDLRRSGDTRFNQR
jgi:hypothetical protein